MFSASSFLTFSRRPRSLGCDNLLREHIFTFCLRLDLLLLEVDEILVVLLPKVDKPFSHEVSVSDQVGGPFYGPETTPRFLLACWKDWEFPEELGDPLRIWIQGF